MADITQSGEPVDIKTRLRQQQEKDDRCYQQLRCDAQAIFRALEGWQKIKTDADRLRVCEEGIAEWYSGQFFLERLGAARYLEPKLLAALFHLRRALLAEGEARTVADMMLVDLTVLSYYNALRVQGWIGDLALLTENEFFNQDSPTEKVRQRHGRLEGLTVEEHLRRLGEQLLPLFERANRMVIRNLRARQELHRGPAPAVAIGRAEQVNVAHQQANTIRQS
jgi:hypothetical protein